MPSYLAKLEPETQVPLTPEGAAVPGAAEGRLPQPLDLERRRGVDRGDGPHRAAASATSTSCLTDHSPRLTVAHGLNRERLEEQLDVVAGAQRGAGAVPHPHRMEVDILEDGGLDLDDDLLERLDVVVASVHSKLRMERQAMTERMVLAVASPHVDILGHCTGRLIGKRPPSMFDADYVFAACEQFDTAVEINSRPERLDPPRELLDLAVDYGCWFSIDSDAHATGQLEWQPHGCNRAAEWEVPIERVVNTLAGGRAAGVDGASEVRPAPSV